MVIKIGSKNITAIKYGSKNISKVYYGSKQIFPSIPKTEPITVSTIIISEDGDMTDTSTHYVSEDGYTYWSYSVNNTKYEFRYQNIDWNFYVKVGSQWREIPTSKPYIDANGYIISQIQQRNSSIEYSINITKKIPSYTFNIIENGITLDTNIIENPNGGNYNTYTYNRELTSNELPVEYKIEEYGYYGRLYATISLSSSYIMLNAETIRQGKSISGSFYYGENYDYRLDYIVIPKLEADMHVNIEINITVKKAGYIKSYNVPNPLIVQPYNVQITPTTTSSSDTETTYQYKFNDEDYAKFRLELRTFTGSFFPHGSFTIDDLSGYSGTGHREQIRFDNQSHIDPATEIKLNNGVTLSDIIVEQDENDLAIVNVSFVVKTIQVAFPVDPTPEW